MTLVLWINEFFIYLHRVVLEHPLCIYGWVYANVHFFLIFPYICEL